MSETVTISICNGCRTKTRELEQLKLKTVDTLLVLQNQIEALRKALDQARERLLEFGPHPTDKKWIDTVCNPLLK